MENKTRILEATANYFSATLAAHGTTALGVGWNGEKSQVIRFDQLLKVISQPDSFSINDLGCGYAALLDYLLVNYHSFTYNGYDISDNMIRVAQDKHLNDSAAHFLVAAEPSTVADYGVASGIFNIRFERSDAECHDCLLSTLDALDRTSLRGFSFNCLTSYSDSDKMQDDLYYADPCVLFDLCKRRYSRYVSLLHDYQLYDFTIIVRK